MVAAKLPALFYTESKKPWQLLNIFSLGIVSTVFVPQYILVIRYIDNLKVKYRVPPSGLPIQAQIRAEVCRQSIAV